MPKFRDAFDAVFMNWVRSPRCKSKEPRSEFAERCGLRPGDGKDSALKHWFSGKSAPSAKTWTNAKAELSQVTENTPSLMWQADAAWHDHKKKPRPATPPGVEMGPAQGGRPGTEGRRDKQV